MMKRLFLAIALLLFLPLVAFANPIACADPSSPCKSGFTYGAQITNSSATQLLATDGNRRCLLIQNQPSSSSSVCLSQGNQAKVVGGLCNGFVLTQGSPYIYSNLGTGNNSGQVPTQLISAIGISGNANVGYSFCD